MTPFLDLKERIILPWAKSDRLYIRASASIALSYMLEQQYVKSDILTLLKHWVSNPNPFLTDTALSTFYWVAQTYPVEALDAIKTILSKEKIFLYLKVIDIFEIIYAVDPSLALEHLHQWLIPPNNSDLCSIAGFLFLLIVRLEDVTRTPLTRQHSVEMLLTLWDNPKISLHTEVQERTTRKIESWAKEAVTAWGGDDPKLFEDYRNLFYDLYRKYEGQRRNRLDFYLQRWQKQREAEQVRAEKLGKDKVNFQPQISFVDLIPPLKH